MKTQVISWTERDGFPFAIVMDDSDAGHAHPEEYDSAHTFPATRAQLIELCQQILILIRLAP